VRGVGGEKAKRKGGGGEREKEGNAYLYVVYVNL
jgi:hypothetical protein